MIERFNIRVYGIAINEHQEVLLSDEEAMGISFTKFPGGGLEFGEGILECLHREFMEEIGAAIEVLQHFYTTEHFVQSAFRKSDQIISVYYRVKLLGAPGSAQTPIEKGAFVEKLTHRWIALENLSENEFRFPIDKIVAGMLKHH